MSSFQIVAPSEDLAVIDTLSDAQKIAAYSKHLSLRETEQIITGFKSGSYEMVTSFVWSRATTVLRKARAGFGIGAGAKSSSGAITGVAITLS